MSQLFPTGGQSIWASASASVLPMNIQSWFPLGVSGLLSLLSRRLSRVFSSTTIQKHSVFFMVQLTSVHDYWKNCSFHYMDFVGKGMSLLFNMLSRLVIAFLARNKCLLIWWLRSLSQLILKFKKMKSVTGSTFPGLFAWSDACLWVSAKCSDGGWPSCYSELWIN